MIFIFRNFKFLSLSIKKYLCLLIYNYWLFLASRKREQNRRKFQILQTYAKHKKTMSKAAFNEFCWIALSKKSKVSAKIIFLFHSYTGWLYLDSFSHYITYRKGYFTLKKFYFFSIDSPSLIEQNTWIFRWCSQRWNNKNEINTAKQLHPPLFH